MKYVYASRSGKTEKLVQDLNLEAIKPILFTEFKYTSTAKPEYLYLLNVQYK